VPGHTNRPAGWHLWSQGFGTGGNALDDPAGSLPFALDALVAFMAATRR
jgi:hypothetical protein